MSEDYAEIDAVGFEVAIAALKLGKFVARVKWDGEFLFFVPPGDIMNEDIDDSRLNDVFKLLGVKSFNDLGNIRLWRYSTGEVINGWVPSQEDMLASDWITIRGDDIADRNTHVKLLKMVESGDVDTNEVLEVISELLHKCGVDHNMSSNPLSIELGDKFPGLLIRGHIQEADVEHDEPNPLYCVVASSTEDQQLMIQGSGSVMSDLTALKKHRDKISFGGKCFQQTSVILNLLTAEELSKDLSLKDIAKMEEERKLVANSTVIEQYEMDAVSAADIIIANGGDPAVFGIVEESRDEIKET